MFRLVDFSLKLLMLSPPGDVLGFIREPHKAALDFDANIEGQ